MSNRWHRCLIVLVFAILPVFVPTPVHAATFNVTHQDDPVPDGCTLDHCSLREAIIAANANEDPDVIQLGSLVYTLSIVGRDEDAAATGDLDVSSPITILSGNGTVVEGGPSPVLGIDRVFDVLSGSLSINGFSVRHGNPGDANGGGVRVATGASLTVDLGTITQNQVLRNGGGIANAGTLSVTNSTVSSNATAAGGMTNQLGGGIANFSSGSITLNGVVVSGNSAGRQGGGVWNGGTGATITGGTITANSTPLGTTNDRDGGGIYNNSNSTLTLTNVAVTNNVSGREGGGILNNGGLTINGGSITGNSTVLDPLDPDPTNRNGGGLRHFSGSVTTISNATISSNTAARGGGGIAGSGNLQLTNSTVTLNQAGTNGGGVNSFSTIVNGVQNTLIISGGTISQNTAGTSGGGVTGSSTTEITGTTISNNQAGLTSTNGPGGGVTSFQSSVAGITTRLTLTDVTVSGNSASSSGGGVAGSGSMTINQSTITGNEAGTGGSGSGGGISASLALVTGVTSRLEMNGGAVSGNTAASNGGGISAFGSDLAITGTLIENNTAGNGGGGIAKGSNTNGSFSHTSSATLTNVQIRGNHATGTSAGGGLTSSAGPIELRDSILEENDAAGGGGGIGNFNTSVLTIFNSAIRDNTAATSGGGITQNTGAASVTLTDSTVSGNRATTSAGGGIASSADVGPGGVTLLRTTFSGNRAEGGGGGAIWMGTSNPGNPAILNIASSTISSNFASGSGAISTSTPGSIVNTTITGNTASGPTSISYGGASLTFRNTILAAGAGQSNCNTALTSQGNNLEFPGNTCGLNAGIGDLPSTNPLLGALANNGGPTLTHLPASNSPVVDAGNNGVCGTMDQRHSGRPLDGNGDGNNVCDVGAVEATSTHPPVVCTSRPVVGVTAVPGQPGRFQATLTAQGPNNEIHSVRFVQSAQMTPNAITDIVNGASNVTAPHVHVPPPGTTQVTLIVRRVNLGTVTLPLLVTDGCGEWPTFVGGGASAF